MQKKKRVLVLRMGGTLSMRASGDGSLEPSEILQNLTTFVPELVDYAEIHYETLANIDSSQMEPDHWLIMARRIKQAQENDECESVVVLHGTDTLAYSSAALSFLLPNLTLPVVLTGSQKPLAVTRTDARNNLLGAVETALHAPLPEVITFFNNKAFRGNRVEKVSIDTFDAFHSPNYPPLGEVGIHWAWQNDRFWPKGRRPTIWPDLPASLPRAPWVLPWLPGLDFTSLACALDKQWALVLEAFGTGNMPITSELKEILVRYIAKGGLIFIRSQVAQGGTALGAYAPGNAMREIGLSGGGDMTREAIVTKLMILRGFGITGKTLKKNMGQSLVGEISEVSEAD